MPSTPRSVCRTAPWVADNPATPDVEVQTWGRVTDIVTPRNAKLSVSFDF